MRSCISILLFIIAGCHLKAQRSQFHLSAGYAFPLGGNNAVEKVINESSVSSTSRKYNLGSGANLQLRADRFFRPSMAAEFAFSYRFHYSRYFSFGKTSYTTVSNEEFETTETNRFYMPQISSGIYMQSEGKRKLFLRSGINLGLFPVLINEYKEETRMTYNSVTTLQSEYHLNKYNRGFSFGLYTAFGIIFPVSEKSSFTIELFSSAQSWSPWFVNYLKYEKSSPGNVEVLPEGKHEIRGLQLPMSCWGLNLGWQFGKTSASAL